MNRELINVIEQIGREKGIDKEILFEAVESALQSACRKSHAGPDNVRIEIDRKTGEFAAFLRKRVVEQVADTETEISLAEAKKLNAEADLDVELEIKQSARPRIWVGSRRRRPSRSSSRRSGMPSARGSTRSSPARRGRSSAASSTGSRSATSFSRSARPRRSCPSASRFPASATTPATGSARTSSRCGGRPRGRRSRSRGRIRAI